MIFAFWSALEKVVIDFFQGMAQADLHPLKLILQTSGF